MFFCVPLSQLTLLHETIETHSHLLSVLGPMRSLINVVISSLNLELSFFHRPETKVSQGSSGRQGTPVASALCGIGKLGVREACRNTDVLRCSNTPTVPKALRRIQEAKEAILPILERHSDQATNMSQAMPSQKLDAKSIWYTDGSKQVRNDGVNVISPEVHNATRGISHSPEDLVRQTLSHALSLPPSPPSSYSWAKDRMRSLPPIAKPASA